MLYRILQTSKLDKVDQIEQLGENRDLDKYFTTHLTLNKMVEDIATLGNVKGPKNITEPVTIKKSRNIIHNRINKAGSTSMMGRD